MLFKWFDSAGCASQNLRELILFCILFGLICLYIHIYNLIFLIKYPSKRSCFKSLQSRTFQEWNVGNEKTSAVGSYISKMVRALAALIPFPLEFVQFVGRAVTLNEHGTLEMFALHWSFLVCHVLRQSLLRVTTIVTRGFRGADLAEKAPVVQEIRGAKGSWWLRCFLAVEVSVFLEKMTADLASGITVRKCINLN